MTEYSEILKKPYSRILIPEENGAYSAEIFEFPGCFASGESANDAIEKLEINAVSWLEACEELGQDIPEPFMNQDYQGKFALRLPRSIHRKSAQFAERDNVSINQFFVSAISARIGAEDLCARLIEEMKKFLQPRTINVMHIEYYKNQTAVLPQTTFGTQTPLVIEANYAET